MEVLRSMKDLFAKVKKLLIVMEVTCEEGMNSPVVEFMKTFGFKRKIISKIHKKGFGESTKFLECN